MALYKIVLNKRVRKKDIPLIPAKDRGRIIKRIEQLTEDPYPPESIKLKVDKKDVFVRASIEFYI